MNSANLCHAPLSAARSALAKKPVQRYQEETAIQSTLDHGRRSGCECESESRGIWASGSNLSFSCPSDALPRGTTSREKEREPNTASQVESESESEYEYWRVVTSLVELKHRPAPVYTYEFFFCCLLCYKLFLIFVCLFFPLCSE